MFVARNKPGDPTALDRALTHARSNPNRDRIAGWIWREITSEKRTLTPIESVIVEELVKHADEKAARELSHVASSLSQSDPPSGTSLLLRVVLRALGIGAHLWGPHEMQYDWSAVRTDELILAAWRAVEAANPGPAEIDIIAGGLASRTTSRDTAAVQDAFAALSGRHEAAREQFVRWRRQTATD